MAFKGKFVHILFFLFSAAGGVRFPPFPQPPFPADMNGAGYGAFNPAAAAAAAATMGVHSTTVEPHPVVPHSTPHTTTHSTLAESGNHIQESKEVH